MKVREAMSPDVETARPSQAIKGIAYCFADDDLATAIRLMEQNRIRRIPVLDHKEHLVGILYLADVAQRAPHRLTAELVEAVSRKSPLSVTINPAAEVLK